MFCDFYDASKISYMRQLSFGGDHAERIRQLTTDTNLSQLEIQDQFPFVVQINKNQASIKPIKLFG